MPDFTTVSVTEAQLRTMPGRQGRYMNEYVDYIQQLSSGQAGRLRIGEQEKPAKIRHRLGVAAKTLGIPLIIKRSGNEIYFWQEDGGEAQPSVKRRDTRRRRLDTKLPPPDQPLDEIGMVEQGIPEEESPE